MQKPKAIIFDLGGVIMDLDIDRAKHALGKLGFTESMFHLQDTGENRFLDLEIGTIDEKYFYQWLCRVAGKHIETSLLEEAWNRMIAGFREEKINMLKKLKEEMPVYLLSNTNVIHIRYCNHVLQEDFGISGLEELFTKTFYSHILGLRKPQPEIFSRILLDIPESPKNILYFDDTPEHLEAARAFGIQTVLHPSNAPLDISHYL